MLEQILEELPAVGAFLVLIVIVLRHLAHRDRLVAKLLKEHDESCRAQLAQVGAECHRVQSQHTDALRGFCSTVQEMGKTLEGVRTTMQEVNRVISICHLRGGPPVKEN